MEDAALLLAALDGTRPADLKGAGLHGVRLMLLETIVLDDVRPQPQSAFSKAIARLEDAGAVVMRQKFTALQDAFELAGVLFAGDSYGHWKGLVEAHPEKMFPQILERVRGGRDVSGAEFVAGWQRLEAIRKEYAAATAGFDAVVLPSAAILPPEEQRLLSDSTYYKTENLLALRNTRVANLMGTCSLTIPAGQPSCGVMLNGHPGKEAALLRIGSAVAAALQAA